MGRPFAGKIQVDIRDSVEDWDPFVPPRAPENSQKKKTPRDVFIEIDDLVIAASDLS